MSIPPTQLTPELWVAQSDFFYTNSGLWLSQGQALLIDPCMRPEEIDGQARFLNEQRAQPQWLLLTHSHWDHILGPERFPEVRVIAQARYPEVVGRDGAGIQHEIAKWEAHIQRERTAPFAIPQPDLTVADDYPVLVGALSLRLVHIPGHAPDQLAVYEPERGCLWAADILSDVEIPFVSDSLADYERTLERLAGFDLRVLVPGHGHASTEPAEIRQRLDDDRAYLAELRDRVTRAVEHGQSVAETVQACAGMRYRHPQANAGPHRLNVESVYLELGGQANRQRVGWQQDWSLDKKAAT